MFTHSLGRQLPVVFGSRRFSLFITNNFFIIIVQASLAFLLLFALHASCSLSQLLSCRFSYRLIHAFHFTNSNVSTQLDSLFEKKCARYECVDSTSSFAFFRESLISRLETRTVFYNDFKVVEKIPLVAIRFFMTVNSNKLFSAQLITNKPITFCNAKNDERIFSNLNIFVDVVVVLFGQKGEFCICTRQLTQYKQYVFVHFIWYTIGQVDKDEEFVEKAKVKNG